MNIDSLHKTAINAARTAGRYIRQQWTAPRQLSQKGFRDLVTATDVAAQKLITDHIRQIHPDHGFLVEETDQSLPTGGPVQWIIDPIDGTSNFSRQIPITCVAIAAAAGDRLLTGVVYDPIRDELFSAAAGQGSQVNGTPIQVSSTSDMIQAIVAFDWARDPVIRQATMATVSNLAPQTQTMRALGSAALALAWIAAGRLDGYFNFGSAPWDAAAGALLIREAGGTITTIARQPWSLTATSSGCVAANMHLAAGLHKALRPPPMPKTG